MKLMNTGKPFPKVTWWRESRLLDSKSENVVQGRVRNTLRIAHLNRSDIGMTLTCQAANNNVSVPASTATVVDMKCKLLCDSIPIFNSIRLYINRLYVFIYFYVHCVCMDVMLDVPFKYFDNVTEETVDFRHGDSINRFVHYRFVRFKSFYSFHVAEL